MRKVFRRLVAAFFVILMLVALFPFQVFAVDPVSASTMANALAQALTAYGASHGVSMMFDVSDTSGIGEGLHDLWGQFKTDINDNNVPTYDSLAVTMWTNLYTKVRDSVAINVSAENVGYFDQFWNWLLSGPAEMTRVDNQYYEWELNDGAVAPIDVYQNSTMKLGDYVCYPLNYVFNYPGDPNYVKQWITSSGTDIVVIPCKGNSLSSAAIEYLVICTTGRFQAVKQNVRGDGAQFPSSTLYGSSYLNGVAFYGNQGSQTSAAPAFAYNSVLMSTIVNEFTDAPVNVVETNDTIDVRPYIGDATPQNVPIPDTSDPDYSPLPYVGPLGVPWIDNNFGDGQSMTDAQREAIAGALDGAIEDDGTLTLEEDQAVPDNPGGEVIGGPSQYTVPGLADVFPFCIPFDIYHFLQALSAEPTPPHFTATLDFPEAVGGSQEIDIDFDTPTFNQIAAILRTMELLAFCVGLALLTRSMFLRG